MNCRGILGHLTDYLHGDAGKEVCKEIEDHLKGCVKCRMHIDSMKLIITLYRHWRDDAIPKDASIRLREVIADVARRKTGGVAPKRSAKRSGKRSVGKKQPD